MLPNEYIVKLPSHVYLNFVNIFTFILSLIFVFLEWVCCVFRIYTTYVTYTPTHLHLNSPP